MKRYVVEFVGTFFLVFTIALSGQPLAIGLMFAAMIYIGHHISGGHYNPAVTLAVWTLGKLKTIVGLLYIVAQLLGGIVASATFNILAQSNFSPAPLENVRLWEAILLEGLFTFVLCSVVLVVYTSKALKNNHIYGLAIGFTLASIIMVAGQITGGVFNPAVGVGSTLYEHFYLVGSNLRNTAIYLIGPSLGGIAAACFHIIINND